MYIILELGSGKNWTIEGKLKFMKFCFVGTKSFSKGSNYSIDTEHQYILCQYCLTFPLTFNNQFGISFDIESRH